MLLFAYPCSLQLNFGMSEATKSKIKAAWGDRSGELKFQIFILLLE